MKDSFSPYTKSAYKSIKENEPNRKKQVVKAIARQFKEQEMQLFIT